MIRLNKPYFDKEELKEVEKVLNSGWVANGEIAKVFEENICEYLNVKHAVAVTNCTSALHLALLSLGIDEFDTVLIADYTFPATGHAVEFVNAEIIFEDIDKDTFNIDISEPLDNDVSVIISVHTFGQMCDMRKLLDITEKNKRLMIEDAACSLGAEYKGKKAGTFGDIGCFSLHGTKSISCGEGGILVTNSYELAEKAKSLSRFGERKNLNQPSSFVELGYNFKMSDVSAAIGIAQLKKIDKIIERRKYLADQYRQELKDIEEIILPFDNGTHIYQSFVCLAKNKELRNYILFSSKNYSFETSIGTYSSCIQPVYCYPKICHTSIDIFKRAFRLPLYYELTESEIKYVSSELKKIIKDFNDEK